MNAPTADALLLIGVLAVFGTVAIIAREKLRPELTSDWTERDFGDQPEVTNLFHKDGIL